MQINNTSPLREVLQAISGTWDLSSDNGWKCLEVGKIRLFKRMVDKDRESTSVELPSKFINSREEITPYLTFKKSEVGGGIINLQQTAIDLQSNEAMMVIIIQF